MQDATAGVCRTLRARIRLFVALLAVMPLSAAVGCQSEQLPPEEAAAGLVLNLESDLTMPKDIDAVSIVVTSDTGETMVEQHYSLGPGVGRHLLPYQIRVPSKGIAARVRAKIIALKHGIARMERSADVELPAQRWGALSLPVNYLCDGTVDWTSSSCGDGQTCDQGRCISTAVSAVPDYVDAAGGGGGAGTTLPDLSGDDNCVNVIDCMSEGLTVQVDTTTCSFEIPVNASGFVNVALKTAKDGFCGPTGCWLPMLFGHAGWTTNGKTVFLPPAVCFEDPASARFQVTVSDACQTFWPSLALCGVAAVSGAEQEDDSAATASAATTAAATIACVGPASRPCPSCGRQTRTCDTATGTWSNWTSCSGGGECALGEFTLNACPGGLPQVCGPTCEWIPCCNPATCFGGRCVDGVCCGNGVLEGDETCEGDCTTKDECDDGIACTRDTYTGSVASCRAECTHTPIIADDDGCCAPGVGESADSDCQAKLCGNGIVDLGEVCDGDCSADEKLDCDDGIACTRDTIADPGTCRARCRHTPVRNDMDKCCAPGQTASEDIDCLCGNGAIDPGEYCDGDCETPSDCNDNNACTADSFVGSAKDCSFHCVNKPIVAPGDNCCAPGQTPETDSDCKVEKGCGNGVVESELGELCEGKDCPTDCTSTSKLACVTMALEGSVATCDARCVQVLKVANNDGCCPPGDAGKTDSDCQPVCGNGLLDNKEVCEPEPISSMTPTCASDQACKSLSACLKANTAADRCNTPCVRDASIPDGQCQVCGDRVLQDNEVCEPYAFDAKSTCPADNECKIVNGPCYILNPDTEKRCAEPCVLSANATNCEPPPLCGNKVLDQSELCDPMALDLNQRCATDAQCKAMGQCMVANKKSSRCTEPCVADPTCSVCGDKIVGADEFCDPDAPVGAGKCPADAKECPAQECMTATLNTGLALCAQPCLYTTIAGCTKAATTTNKPSTPAVDMCGDGKKTGTEACDPGPGASVADACPKTDAECADTNECTTDRIKDTVDLCARICEHVLIAGCQPGQSDKPSCGDKTVTPPEKCDKGVAAGAGKCPVSAADCDDNNACTADTVMGAECQAECVHTPIVACNTGAAGNGGAGGSPAPAMLCGNGVVDAGEKCDTNMAGSCPVDAATDCPPPTQKCMVAKIVGSECAAQCSTVAVQTSVPGDNCCLPNTSHADDSDCPEEQEPAALCGNGNVEAGEECDGKYAGSKPCASEMCVMRVATCTADCKNECVETPIASTECAAP